MIVLACAVVGGLLGGKAGRALGRAVEQEIARQFAWAEYHRQQALQEYWEAQRQAPLQ